MVYNCSDGGRINEGAIDNLVRFRFTGKEWDEETKLYYMSARYQNPMTSRWMSADPAGAGLVDPMRDNFKLISGLNWYAYTENNPVNYTDPTGLDPIYAGMDSNYYYSGNKTPFFGYSKKYAQTQKDLVDGKYVWGGNDPSVDGGVDCSGAILYGLKKMGYDIPDTNAEGIIKDLTKPVSNGEYTEGDIRALHDSDDNSVIHVQTLLDDGRVNPHGDSNNDIDNPGEIEKLTGAPPASGTKHVLDWEKIEQKYGEKEYIDSWRPEI